MRNAPHGALAVTTGQEVTQSVSETTVTTDESRCLLCPLCLCHFDCHGVAEAVSA
jgi:hypothetical protein